MNYLSWWSGGLLLSAVVIFHLFATGRMMAVSGRFTAIVNLLRDDTPKREPQPTMSEAELLAAIAAVTADEFGDQHAPDPDAAEAPKSEDAPEVRLAKPATTGTHLVFFASLVMGGLSSALLREGPSISWTLSSQDFASYFGQDGPSPFLVLLLGGTMVGFGTRMAGGCTSGHGLCGVSRLQPGSIVATSAFFASGIATALLLSWM